MGGGLTDCVAEACHEGFAAGVREEELFWPTKGPARPESLVSEL